MSADNQPKFAWEIDGHCPKCGGKGWVWCDELPRSKWVKFAEQTCPYCKGHGTADAYRAINSEVAKP